MTKKSTTPATAETKSDAPAVEPAKARKNVPLDEARAKVKQLRADLEQAEKDMDRLLQAAFATPKAKKAPKA
jgi:hypothetical protein